MSRKKRYVNKLHKTENEYKLEVLMKYWNWSLLKAREVVDLYSDEQIHFLEQQMIIGGKESAKKK